MCPEAYRRRYVENERMPPGIAALCGKGVHAGAQANFSQKMETYEDLHASDIVDAAVAGFDAELHGGEVSLDDDQVARGPSIVTGEARDDVAVMAKFHALEQAPEYQPIMVEQRIELELTGNNSLLAIIDLADDTDRIVDFKTAKRSKQKSDADTSLQLTVYDVAFEAETGRKASELMLDTIVQTKKETKRQILKTTRTDRDREVLAARVDAAERLIAAGTYIPTAPGNWMCSLKWCGFARTCPYFNAERQEKSED